MIVGGQTEARAQLSSTIIDYHELFDQGLKWAVWADRDGVHLDCCPEKTGPSRSNHQSRVICVTSVNAIHFLAAYRK